MSAWISVKDKLPRKRQVVLVSDGKSVSCGMFRGIDFGSNENWIWRGNRDKIVTHWQELPEPPEE